jgi:hypothetical protein
MAPLAQQAGGVKEKVMEKPTEKWDHREWWGDNAADGPPEICPECGQPTEQLDVGEPYGPRFEPVICPRCRIEWVDPGT